MSNAVHYYFLAPTWHNHPTSGPLQLGNVFTDLRTPEQPLHRGPPPPLPKSPGEPPDPGAGEQTTSWQTKYHFSQDDTKAGGLGLWTKFLSILGVGVEFGYELDKCASQKYTFERLETREFTPGANYIQTCLQAPPVARLIARKKRTFYIVTGIKAVTGANASSAAEAGHRATAGIELDASVLGGAPVSLGPEAHRERRRSQGVSWSGSSDFVFAYRLQKITVSRSGQATHENFKKGTMLDRERQQEAGRGSEDFVLSALEVDEISSGGFALEDADGQLCAIPPAAPG